MIALAYYLLKVIICSGILFSYYYLALRNKQYHQWNRFYLLSTIVLSLVIPCFQLFVWETDDVNAKGIQLLTVVASADDFVAEADASTASFISLKQLGAILYIIISMVLLVALIKNIQKINTIIKTHTINFINNIKFIDTDVEGSPFSYFKYIFWNKTIDISSATGHHIFQHELVHVREKHTLDKLFMQIVLIAFWINPFFWLIRKELKMIHEFIADKRSVGQSDAATLAAMILQSAYPNYYNNLTNQFFQTSIKRRLSMLTKNQTQKISYAGRLLALPVLAFIVFAFTSKTKNNSDFSSINLAKEITVVIDAGHGGQTGARAENIFEDDLVLDLANAIKENNRNEKINIILTRNDKPAIGLKERVKIAEDNKADLFISLHINALAVNGSSVANEERNNGIEVLVPKDNTPYLAASKIFASSLIQNLKTAYPTFSNPLQPKNGVWVLNANVCPAVLIECGYITNDKDREFISEKKNQKIIAQKILRSIEQYASTITIPSSYNSNTSFKKLDSIPKIQVNTKNQNPLVIIDGKEKGRLKEIGKLETLIAPDEIQSVNVLKDESAIKKYGKKAEDGVIEITSKNEDNKHTNVRAGDNDDLKVEAAEVRIKTNNTTDNKALLVIDGVEKGPVGNSGRIEALVSPRTIISINVLKDQSAIKKYGKNGEHGVIEVVSKLQSSAKHNEEFKFEASEINIKTNNITDSKALLVIDGVEKGPVGNSGRIEALVSPRTIISISVLKDQSAIKKYGKNGEHGVIEVVTKAQFNSSLIGASATEQDVPNTIFSKTEIPALFPGGKGAWSRYLQKTLDAKLPVERGAIEGSYEVVIQFVVNKDGTLQDFQPQTKHGFGMEDEVIRILSRGPRWTPAIQNGKNVACYVKQPVTFVIQSQ